MPNPQRLEFIARHFGDLQAIRFAPVPALMILALAAHRLPHASRSGARGMLLGFLLLVAGFYWWSGAALRRRYGTVKVSRKDTQRMQRHPMIIALFTIVPVLYFLAPHTYFSDLYISSTILVGMLTIILDSTNLASRRIAWAIGLVVLFAAGPFLIGIEAGAAIFSLAGTVWLSLSVFDFLLLRRTFAEISASSPTGAAKRRRSMAKPLSILPPKPPAPGAQGDSLVTILADLNRVVHEPARLAILTVLANCESADFTFLETSTGLTKGNLSVQLTRLEEASLIRIEKAMKKNRTVTTAHIVAEGRYQLERYWQQMNEIRDAVHPAAVKVSSPRA